MTLAKPTVNANDNSDDFLFAQGLIRRVGKHIRASLKTEYVTTWKPDNTPVTSIDMSANAQINDAIRQTYPDDRIFGEEASLKGTSGFTWIVDPIDGTQSLGMLPTFTCCIARLDSSGQPLFGLVYNPTTDELYAAKYEEKATMNGEPLQVSLKDQLTGSYVFIGSRMPKTVATNGIIYDKLEAQGAKIFNARSLAFGCMMVASGKAEGAFIGVSTPFEAASVKLIVEGAGGRTTDLFGSKPGRLDGEIKGMVVSNGRLHDELLVALQKG